MLVSVVSAPGISGDTSKEFNTSGESCKDSCKFNSLIVLKMELSRCKIEICERVLRIKKSIAKSLPTEDCIGAKTQKSSLLLFPPSL